MADGRRPAPEELAEEALEKYFAHPGAPRDRVDPWVLGREVLGCRIEYRRLSPEGDLLGLTSAGPLWVRVWDRAGAWARLDGRTILLDGSLASPWESPGRRNFTLAHEIAHLLLCRAVPGAAEKPLCCRPSPEGWEERRADALASALLLPEGLVLRGLRQSSLPPIIRVLNPWLDPEGWRRFSALAGDLGVSRQALALRLRRLGRLRREYRPFPRDKLDITMEEDEPCREST